MGHSELFCQSPGSRDADGNLPFGAGLRAPDDRKKAGSSDNSSREHYGGQNSKRDSTFSSSAAEPYADVTSPLKKYDGRKRKGKYDKKVYRRVDMLQQNTPGEEDNNQLALVSVQKDPKDHGASGSVSTDGGLQKKRKTPTTSENSAEAALQPCPPK